MSVPFDANAYGPIMEPLVAGDRRRSLGPGEPDRAARAALEALAPDGLLPGVTPADPAMARLVIAGAWLIHDWLDEAHRICQAIETPSGAYWHGIMHRREPDASNANYWFRRVGDHPVFAPLAEAARQLAAAAGPSRAAERLANRSEWDPFLFVEVCESARGGSPAAESLCREVQQREWELLFDFCWYCWPPAPAEGDAP